MQTETERKKREAEARRRNQRAADDDISNPAHPANPLNSVVHHNSYSGGCDSGHSSSSGGSCDSGGACGCD